MAKGMKSKIQPAVMRLAFTGTTDADADDRYYIDLSQCLSLVNRRFYRQGLNWAVAGFKLVARGMGSSYPPFARIGINTLPHTWVMSNAWEKGFRTWMKQQKDALSENEGLKPKFLDFKIYMNEDHATAVRDQKLLPVDSEDSQIVSHEDMWVHSKAVIPEYAGTGQAYEFKIAATGNTNFTTGVVSLIEGYAASRGLPHTEDPNTPNDAATDFNWFTAMFNEGTRQDQTVIDNLITEQNHPPYAVEGELYGDTQYPGGANNFSGLEILDEVLISPGTNFLPMNAQLKGGTIPCGLIEFRVNNFFTGSGEDPGPNLEWDLFVDLIPGTHRGYLAEPMTEM